MIEKVRNTEILKHNLSKADIANLTSRDGNENDNSGLGHSSFNQVPTSSVSRSIAPFQLIATSPETQGHESDKKAILQNYLLEKLKAEK